MADITDIYQRATDAFGRRLDLVTDAHWALPTPCTEWSVRDLVAHVLDEQLWIPPLVEGQTIDQVGDRFAGDQIGADAARAWSDARRDVVSVLAVDGAAARTVSLSFGPATAADYVEQVTADTFVHTWDLARAVGGDERLDAADVEWTIGVLAPVVERFRAAGVFGPLRDVAPDADAQARLLALVGRDP